ncbi:CWC22 [[Candida] subhashii]|uniref:Pre-mRNA-splicing factor CWC22 n=1 Tax=[Candida] subhashii TaxID=561895 RepID=A0A8J5UXD1_9ASCO|nr:CWC22 [[Candida] subhashii]KAG7662284.1 CWC22 [[Candida] subhashii]
MGDGNDTARNVQLQKQKQQWKQLKRTIEKSITNLDTNNIKSTVIELFKCNLIRGKGLFVRCLMKWQLIDYRYAAMFSCLVAVINSKIPEIGELLCKRLVIQFKKNYIKNHRRNIIACLLFLGNLVNQQVVSEIVMLQIIQLLLESPNDESIEIAVRVLKVIGAHLDKHSQAASNMIFDRLRDILQDDKSIGEGPKKQITSLINLRRSKFKGFPSIPKEFDIVEDEDRETHIIDLQDDDILAEDELNIFQYDEEYDDHEEEYEELRKEILEEEEGENTEPQSSEVVPGKEAIVVPDEKITDMSQQDLVQFQKTVYLTIMSSMSSDEAVHKLLRLKKSKTRVKDEDPLDDDEVLADMIIKCCSQEKTYSKYFGIIIEKLCGFNQHWHDIFVNLFKKYYTLIENFETNSIRNIGKLFGHLFASDQIELSSAWNEIQLTEQDTNPAIRILLKFIFQEMIEGLGIKEVKERLINDEYIKPHIRGLLPVVDVTWEDADHLRFSINFFTAIGLGTLTDEMRDVLKNLPAPPERGRSRSRSGSSRSSYSEGSYSRSRSRSYSRSVSYSRSPSYSRSRSRSRSISRGRPRSRSDSKSRSQSYSRSPANGKSRSYSRSPIDRGRQQRQLSNDGQESRTPSREPRMKRNRSISPSINEKQRNIKRNR